MKGHGRPRGTVNVWRGMTSYQAAEGRAYLTGGTLALYELPEAESVASFINQGSKQGRDGASLA